jgi:hypothetical protein
MMLRSAEADPHVTEHVSRSPAEAGERARAKSRAPCGDAEASSRDTQSNRPAKEATPVRPSRECFARGPKASVRWCRNRSHDSLGNHPRRRRSDAGDWARSNLAVQPTSRRCSADESVVSHRRCQRRDTRSFHGLCSSSRFHVFRSAPAMPNWQRHSFEPKPERVAPSLSPAQQATSASGRQNPSRGSLPLALAEAVAKKAVRGAEAERGAAPFQRCHRAPEPRRDRLEPKPEADTIPSRSPFWVVPSRSLEPATAPPKSIRRAVS